MDLFGFFVLEVSAAKVFDWVRCSHIQLVVVTVIPCGNKNQSFWFSKKSSLDILAAKAYKLSLFAKVVVVLSLVCVSLLLRYAD